MLKRRDKLLSILVLLLVGFSLAISSFAHSSSNTDLNKYSIYEIQAGLVPNVDPSILPQRSSASSVVCVMRLYSDNGGGGSSSSDLSDFGHSFLTFLNVSSQNITVGQHTVAPGKMVSVGKFGNLGTCANDFKGAFYNVEAQRKDILGWYGPDVSMYLELTASQLSAVSNILINKQSGYLTLGNNCATFAAAAWNSVAPSSKKIMNWARPADIYNEIIHLGSYARGNGLIDVDYARCYFNGSTKVICGDRYIT